MTEESQKNSENVLTEYKKYYKNRAEPTEDEKRAAVIACRYSEAELRQAVAMSGIWRRITEKGVA